MLAREPAHRFQPTRLAYEALLESVGLHSNDLAVIHRRMLNELQETLPQ